MNSHEEQVIIELASGSLPREEARRLEATLSEEAQRELAAHRLVLGAIADDVAPVMTDIERARLHRRVAEAQPDITRELSATEITTPVPRQAPRARTVRWMRFASAATVAALFVGVVAVGSQLNFGSGDSDSSDTTSPAASTDTTVAASDRFQALEPEGLSVPQQVPAPTTIIRQPGDLAVPVAPSVDAETEESDLEDLARFITEASEVDAADLVGLACFDVALEAAGPPAVLDSVALATQPEVIVKAFTVEYRSRAAVGFQSGAVDDEEAIRIYDLQTCEELATTPR